MAICPTCGSEYFTNGKYCKKCTREHKLAYNRNYTRNQNMKTLRIKPEDYKIIKEYSDMEGITMYESLHRLILYKA